MRLFLTQKSYARAIAEAVRTEPTPGKLMIRYSENPELLRQARAAFDGLSEPDGFAAYRSLNTSETSVMLTPIKRAICAYAVGLQKLREGL